MTRRPSASSVAGLLVGVLAASAMLFTKLAMDVSGGEPIVSFDRATAVWLHVHATGSVTDVLAAVTQLGAAVVLLPVTLAAARHCSCGADGRMRPSWGRRSWGARR